VTDPDVAGPADHICWVCDDEGRVTMSGSVDACGADRLRRILAAGRSDRAGTATLDLTGPDFADAAGCRAIAGWAHDPVAAGRSVAVVGASPVFAKVWQLLGYDRIVPVPVRGQAA
jgi:anti-anti-sigma factor